MKLFLKIILISSVFIFTACQKEIDADIAGDYQPVSFGSEWNYTSSVTGNFKITSAGTDTSIYGKKYFAFNQNSGGIGGITTRLYKSKTNGIYRQFGVAVPLASSIVITYLKDTAVGTSWTDTAVVGGVNNYHRYTIVARDGQKVVTGEKYFKVIEVGYQLSIASPLGGVINVGSGKNYYAKNIGSIESILTVGLPGLSFSDTTQLTSVIIK